MKLLYIHQYFVTNEGTSGTRSYDVSKHLVQMGHQVTAICGVYWQGTFPRMPWWRWFDVRYIDGIRVVICNAWYSNKMGVPARMWAFLKFALLATLVCLWERGADLIFATSTPLTVGIPARVASSIRGIPYVFEVRDLWPEDLLAAGRLKPGFQYQAWEWLEEFSYQGAKKILLVSKGFHDRLLERGFAPDLLQTVLLGADGDLFQDLHPDQAYLEEHGLKGKTIAVYTGAHGDANGLMQVIEAAEFLRHRSDIAVVLIGDGKAKASLAGEVARRELTNVHLLDFVPKHRLPNILAACHIGLMILKQIARPRWVTPNKIFDYMFAGLPSIVNFAGTTAEMVVADGTGVASEPGSAKELAAKIGWYADHPEERAALGRHACNVAWQKYDRKMIAQQLASVFEDCLRSG